MTSIRPGLTTLALVAAATASHAASVTVTFDSPIFTGMPAPHFDVVKITYPKLIGTGAQNATVFAGRFQGSASNLVGVDPGVFVDSVNDVFMYCYDVYDSIHGGRVVDYTINFDGETARTLDFLGAVNAMLNAGDPTPDPYAWTHPATAWQAAAIQLGIWESKYDTGWDIDAGTFKATHLESATRTALAGFFAAIPGAPSIDNRFVMTLEARGAQDMITGDPPPARVPEPRTTALLLAAAAGLAVASRRRRRRTARGALQAADQAADQAR
jgi:hypothetical protein